MKKRLLSLFLILTLCFSFVVVQASAANAEVSGTYSQGVVTVTGSGFDAGILYSMISVRDANGKFVSSGYATADVSGNISTTITTGKIEDTTNYTVTVYSNVNGKKVAQGPITAQTSTTTHTIKASAGTGGSITPSGDVSVEEGKNQTFTISANSNYTISDVTVDSKSVGSVSTYTFENVTADHTIAATFRYNGGGGGGGSSGGSGGGGGGGGGGSSSGSSSSTGADTNVTVPATASGDGAVTATMNTTNANQMVNNAVKNKSKNVTINVTAPANATNVAMSMPKSAVQNLSDKTSATLTVVTPLASVTFTNEAVGNLASKGTKTVGVAVEKADDIFKVTVQADGNAVAELDGMKATLPVDEKAGMGTVAILVNPDGSETIIKKSIPANGALAFALNGSATIRIKDNSKAFPDAEGHWATDSIQFVTGRELFNGVNETRFAPNSPMTRAMLVTVLHRLEDLPAGGTSAFSDTAAGLWYSDAVAWASEKGIVNGNPDGTFRPNGQITREQLATMLYRYATSVGMETSGASSLSQFADGNQVSSYAMDAISWAVEKGVINGKSHDKLDPKGNATRAEVATMLMRLVGIMH